MSRAHAASTSGAVHRLRTQWTGISLPSDVRPALRALTIVAGLALAATPVRLGEPATTDAAHLLPESPATTLLRVSEPIDPRAYVRERASRDRGWTGREWACLRELIQRESSWNPQAASKTSSARGLFQVLNQEPGLSIQKQTAIGLRYIAHRHDTPCQALRHSYRLGWY